MNIAITQSQISRSEDFPDLSDDVIGELVREIDRAGYAVVPDFLTYPEVEGLRAFVRGAVRAAGDSYVCFTGPEAVAGTALERVAKSPVFRQMCARIFERATGRPAPDQPYHQILRCLIGRSGEQNSFRFHYDSYVLTALVPIDIPKGRRSGDLLILPNTRAVRTWYARNLIDKMLVDNPLSHRLFRWLNKVGSSRVVRISMTPGHLYLFWGYRSVHTNEPCDPDKIRATALFHYGDPHRDSRLKRFLHRRN